MITQGLTLGMMYPCLNGSWVTMVVVHNKGSQYETMEDEYGCNRYSNIQRLLDLGRCTGRSHNDPRNIDMRYLEELSRSLG